MPSLVTLNLQSNMSGPLLLGLGAGARLRTNAARYRRPQHSPPASCSSRSASSDSRPLLDAVAERGNRSADVPFHVPGHKRGSSTPHALRQLLGDSLKYDLTELEGLDYLASPSGAIAEAQALASRTWGAGATWFLVNGSTTGIHAAVMATCGPGKALLLARNAHLSAFNAMVLAGCDALYVQPQYDPHLGVAHQVTAASLEATLQSAQEAGQRVGAVLVVSPTYFGVLSDIHGLADVCHRRGLPLLVDEAHGAHLGLAPGMPPSALQQGADVVIQSTHKQLSAMTQAGMMHAAGGRVEWEKLARALQVLQSSSPSYLLMSSLDAARAQASHSGAFTGCLAAAAFVRQHAQQLQGIALLSEEQLHGTQEGEGGQQGSGGSSSSRSCSSEAEEAAAAWHGVMVDPLRITFTFQGLGLSGYEAAAILEEQHSIVPELAGPACVVLALSIGSTMAHAEALVAALERMSADGKPPAGDEHQQQRQPVGAFSEGGTGAAAPPPPVLQQPAVSPREAFFAASERVPVTQAAGRIAAELVCPYPPGVPALFPGEVITPQILASLSAVHAVGGRIAGCADPSFATVAVLQR